MPGLGRCQGEAIDHRDHLVLSQLAHKLHAELLQHRVEVSFARTSKAAVAVVEVRPDNRNIAD